MRVTTYGHAMILSIMGVVVMNFNSLLWGFCGGLLIGVGLLLARQSGREENL
jgi:hypothetical protein